MASLGEVTSAGAEGWLDGCVGSDPVCEGVFAVLDDTVDCMIRIMSRRSKWSDLRLARLISVISFTCLAWCDWGVIDKLQKMLSEAGNDSKLLAMLLDRIKLVGESCL